MLVCFLMASLRCHLVRKLIGVYKLMMLYTHQENKTTSKKEQTNTYGVGFTLPSAGRVGRYGSQPSPTNRPTPLWLLSHRKLPTSHPFWGCWRITNYRRTTSFGVVGPLQTAHKSNFSQLYARHHSLLNSTTCTLCYP